MRHISTDGNDWNKYLRTNAKFSMILKSLFLVNLLIWLTLSIDSFPRHDLLLVQFQINKFWRKIGSNDINIRINGQKYYEQFLPVCYQFYLYLETSMCLLRGKDSSGLFRVFRCQWVDGVRGRDITHTWTFLPMFGEYLFCQKRRQWQNVSQTPDVEDSPSREFQTWNPSSRFSSSMLSQI